MGNTSPTRNSEPRPLALVLLGESGSGKSASGNTILRKKFFRSEVSSKAITKECKESEENIFCGRQCIVIDTPDFCHVSLSNISEHVRECRQMCEGRQCVYLLVIQIGRFTEGERNILGRLERALGRIRDRTIILFTYGDNLMSDQTIHHYTKEAGENLQSLIQKCGNRYMVINNKDIDKKEEQVAVLLEELMTNIDKLEELDRKKKRNCKKVLDCIKWLLPVGFVVLVVTILTRTLPQWLCHSHKYNC